MFFIVQQQLLGTVVPLVKLLGDALLVDVLVGIGVILSFFDSEVIDLGNC